MKNNLRFVSFSSHFLFFVLVDKVTKNENSLRDFLYDVFCLQGKTGKMKMKKIKNKKKDPILRLGFCTLHVEYALKVGQR